MPTGTEGNTPHLPFPAAAAAQLLELLSTDDAYRSLFASDKAAALKQLGLTDDFIVQALDGGESCLSFNTLASKQDIAGAKAALTENPCGKDTYRPVFCLDASTTRPST